MIWVNTILYHIDTRVILLRCEGFLYGIYTQMASKFRNTIKYPYLTGIKNCETLILDTCMVSETENSFNLG